MADEPRPLSVKERMAQLKLSQVGRTPEQPSPARGQTANGISGARGPPPPPPGPTIPQRPTPHARAQSTNVPTNQGRASIGAGIGNQPDTDNPTAGTSTNGSDGNDRPPALPPRTASQSSQRPALPPRRPSGPSPGLPPRRPSDTPSTSTYGLNRRGSNGSVSSVATARSSVSGISQSDRTVKAPAYDASALPPLPPNMTEEQKEAYHSNGMTSHNSGRRALKPTNSAPNVLALQNGTTPPPARRPSFQPAQYLPPPPEEQRLIQQAPAALRIRQAEPPRPRRSALEMGMSSGTRTQPNVPATRSGSVPQATAAPPPVPTASRPDLVALQACKPKATGSAPPASVPAVQGACLHCRDFSGPDNHAARFPRQSLPSSDVGYLANQLTAPFPSQTDKARAIFTWLHHNVSYDTKAFFSGNVRPSTPQSTLASGLAVCEGYAGLFAALALKAGLESYVVAGHGKGYGYSPLKPGEAIPAFNAGHAWNAVKIDSGKWKLIDPCWGAGSVDNNLYKQRFAPERFTQSNEDFGLDHYPEDSKKQFRSDGRVVAWEEYYVGEKKGSGAVFYTGYTTSEGIAEPSFRPAGNPIVLAQQGPTVRFSFQKICPHWDPSRNGKGAYCLYTLAIENLQGSPKNHVPFETNGEVWWCDVPLADLGRQGQTVSASAVTSFRDRDGRGLTAKEYEEWRGRCTLGWAGVAKWTLA
ncbi:hypothetical protein LTR08_001481 [Meristemomyces frigidus]|nr:hypothetical protein LTR08_001481 [Meristemomyces frigidus]